MKSSVRILAIALALAFLLLARTALQDTSSASADPIKLKDGEAAFADPIDGMNEAEYLGFGGKATTTVYFYIDSDDLGTQVTAKTMVAAGSNNVVNVRDASSYQYKSGDSFDEPSEVNSALHYIGGANQPLAGTAKLSVGARNLPNAITNATTGEITSLLDIATSSNVDVEFTFDIVDMYAASDETGDADAPAYVSGYGRAYVSSGSDSGQWVDITEVAMVNGGHNAAGSPTSNLFRGMVVITNDTDEETDDVIYAQDGDTLTLQVFDENGNRSSDVLATATAMVDDSKPTISDLSPADETITNDDTLRISFSVNDEGAGVDFRNIEKVVTMVQAQKIQDDKMGAKCTLASGAGDIDNAGGNASRVGVLIAPANAKFSGRCGSIVDTGNDGEFNLIITAQDSAGNVTTHTTQLTIDTSKPTVMGNPAVGRAWNADKNTHKDSANSILVQFSEALDADTVAAADFTVAGYTVDNVEVVGTNEKDGDQNLNKYVVITLTEDLANNARPSVTIEKVSDVAGNAIQKATRTSDNKIKAKLTVVPFTALIAEDGQQAINFTSDEALRSRSGNNSTEGSVGDGKVKITVADDTMGGNANFKESTYGGSRAYGVLLQAVDVNGNVSQAGAVKVSDEAHELAKDVVAGAKFDVTLDNWPLADTDFDNDVAGAVKAYVGKTMVAASTGVVDWTTGVVELQANADRAFKAGDSIDLSYSYVNADQVIQVDVDAPTMTSIPADNAETDYAAGAIQFKWNDDDGYAGDSYKTVTLNSATHEANGTSTDILSKLSTNDNKTWVLRPAEDLALGDHEFTLMATDAAGNEATVSVTITVVERKPVKIDLNPGWNLISFRGTPASLDVSDIFSDDTVRSVTQYDGRKASPFTVWSRDSEGNFMSSPAGRTSIDPGLGLWVNSSDGTDLSVDIPGVSRDAPAQVPPSIDLIPGWNLVAVIIINREETSVGVNEYLPAGVWSRAFYLDNVTGQLRSISPPADIGTSEPGTSIKAGQALWVYATSSGTIVPK